MLEIELLQISMGNRERLSRTPSEKEWHELYQFAKKQTVAGVMFYGLKLLPEEQKPEYKLIGKWYMLAGKQEQENDKMDKWCTKISLFFLQHGYECWILKGQALNRLYGKKQEWNKSEFLANANIIRTIGDIDVWVMPKIEPLPQLEERHKIIYNFCKQNIPNFKEKDNGGKHTSFEVDDIIVEVHYTPHTLRNLKYDNIMQKWFIQEFKKDKQDKIALVKKGSFPTATLEFNLTYILLHIQGHYMFEGIGLRQIVDYYLILQKMMEEEPEEIERLKHFTMQTLTSFGAEKFTAALMWVLCRLFVYKDKNNDIEWLLCKPDKWRGKMLLKAIINGGNFGKYNKINSETFRGPGIKRIVRYIEHQGSLLIAYPNAVIWHTGRRIYEAISTKGREN